MPTTQRTRHPTRTVPPPSDPAALIAQAREREGTWMLRANGDSWAYALGRPVRHDPARDREAMDGAGWRGGGEDACRT